MVTDKKLNEWETLAWSDKKPEKKYKKLELLFQKNGLMVANCNNVEEYDFEIEEFKPVYKRLELAEDMESDTECALFTPLDYVPNKYL